MDAAAFLSSEKPRRADSGQALVESALVLPLVLFLVLGTTQLFMMLQGRLLAEYAAYRAARAGSVNHGSCEAMNHAAIAALLPAFARTDTPTEFANAFRARRNNSFGPTQLTSGASISNEAIVWIFRERPTAGAWAGPDDERFDYDFNPMSLEIRLVFWFPLRIPLADWVITRMLLAHYGMQPYVGYINPLSPAQVARWPESMGYTPPAGNMGVFAHPEVVTKFRSLAMSGKYLYPIQATHAMRMMTPAKRVNWQGGQHCPPTP